MNDIKVGDKLEIHCYKHNGKIDRISGEALVLDVAEDYLVCANNKVKITESDGKTHRTKETAILMIADAVESASRTLKDHSQEELDALIHKIIKDRLDDNQLSDSPLTLKDIKIIAETLSRVLRSVFHKRIKYQEAIEDIQNKEQMKQDETGKNEN